MRLSPPSKLWGADYREFLNRFAEGDVLGITCAGKKDGGGAQILATLNVQLFAQHCGFDYFHTPLHKVEHDPGQDTEWPQRWEETFNLGAGENPVPNGADCLTLDQYCKAGCPKDVIVALKHCHAFFTTRGGGDCYRSIHAAFLAKYLAGRRKPNVEDTRFIAVHIRRGDVSADNRHAVRFTQNADILKSLEQFRALVPTAQRVRVFSQGRREDFADLLALGDVDLDLNGDVFDAIEHMRRADGLMVARSAFSFLPALLAPNRPIFMEVGHKPWGVSPMTGWYVPGKDRAPVRHEAGA